MRSKKRSVRLAATDAAKFGVTRPSTEIHPRVIPASLKNSLSPASCPPEEPIDFAELEDGSLVETIEDPQNSNRTLLAIYRRGKVRVAERIKYHGRILVPVPRNAVGFSDVKLPQGVRPYKSVENLMLDLLAFFRIVVDVPVKYEILLSIFVLYTWIADRLPISVYLSVVGLPQSGKSTLLELLNLLCRRSLFVSDASQASIYQACGKFSPTLIVDEIDWRSSTTTRSFLQLLRAGTSPTSRVLRVRHSSNGFGPKILGSLEPSPDSALNSRCIRLVMAETNRHDLLKPHTPKALGIASRVRRELLKFRFNHYESIRPAVVLGAEELRPRSRDVVANLAAPMVGHQRWIEALVDIIKLFHDPETREPLDPRQEALHAALWTVIHLNPPLEGVRVGGRAGLTTYTNEILHQCGARSTVTDRAVGSMLASLGFRNKDRRNSGWVLWLDPSTVTRCHQLLKTHGNQHIPQWNFTEHSNTCLTCKSFVASNRT